MASCDFLHLPVGELGGKRQVCVVVFCHDQAPAGIFVEAMNNAGSSHPANAAEPALAMVQ